MDVNAKIQTSNTIDKYKSIISFFSEIINICKGKNFIDMLNCIKPYFGDIAKDVSESAEEAFGIAKFIISLWDKIGEIKDEREMGYFICTSAYQNAFAKALNDITLTPEININENKISELQKFWQKKDDYQFELETFDFAYPLSHSSILYMDEITMKFLTGIGIKVPLARKIIGEIHLNFLSSLREILVDASVKKKFGKFISLVEGKTDLEKAQMALKEYGYYQKWLFDEKKLFDEKDFSLNDVYVNSDCFDLTKDYYLNYDSYRNVKPDLGNKVLSYITNPNFNAPIIIEGTAGSGKSSFTLKLCKDLIEHGLRPIRIPFKCIDFDAEKTYFDEQDIYKILERTINFRDEERYGQNWPQVNGNLFCSGNIFNERFLLKKSSISPYVIILDGWDELTITAQKNFNNFLNGVYETFINNKNNTIRLVMTGRPSNLINPSCKVNSKETAMLSIRDLSNDSLLELLHKLNKFNYVDPEIIKKIVINYGKSDKLTYRILGLPLIVFIVHELLSDTENDLDYKKLFGNKAILYKELADLTCKNAGKRKQIKEEKLNYRIYGENLRRVLQKTAKIISLKGHEQASYDDLKLLLKEKELTIAEEDISKIVVSYYFKGGYHNAGCEFAHKSFREYFYAEAIINALDEYSYAIREIRQKKPKFKDNIKSIGPLNKLVNELIGLLAFQPITEEVFEFVEGLLEINFLRAKKFSFGSTMKQGLVQIWDWWVNSNNIKYRINSDRGIEHPDIIKSIEPYLKISPVENHILINNLDSNFGDGVLRLCVILHYFALKKVGINSLNSDNIEIDKNTNANYQIKVNLKEKNMLMKAFVPFGLKVKNPNNIINRINLSKREFELIFYSCYFDNLHLNNCNLSNANFSGSFFVNINLQNVCLNNVVAKCIRFIDVDVSTSDLYGIELDESYLKGTNFTNATLTSASIQNSNVDECNFSRINAESANFESSSMVRAIFNQANLNNSIFNDVNLRNGSFVMAEAPNSKFECAKLFEANFSNSNLSNCNFSGAICGEVNFSMANLSKVNFIDANLGKANFACANLSKADLRKTNFVGNNLNGASFADANVEAATFSNINFNKVKNLTKEQKKKAIIK